MNTPLFIFFYRKIKSEAFAYHSTNSDSRKAYFRVNKKNWLIVNPKSMIEYSSEEIASLFFSKLSTKVKSKKG